MIDLDIGGDLFVSGSEEATKAVQDALFERDRLRDQVAALRSAMLVARQYALDAASHLKEATDPPQTTGER